MVKMENAITVKGIAIRNYRYIKFCEHVKKIEMIFFYGWLDSAQIFCGFDSRKTRLHSTRTFYGSAFAASAAAPRSFRSILSRDRSIIPWNFRSRYPGPFLPWTIRSFVSRAVPGPPTKKEHRLYFTVFSYR